MRKEELNNSRVVLRCFLILLVGRPQGRGKVERFFQKVNEYMLADPPGYIHHGKQTSNPKLTIPKLDEITH